MHRPPRKLTSRLLTPVIALSGLASTAMAHPGHADEISGAAAGLVHPLSGIDHLIAMVMVGVLAVRMSHARVQLLGLPALFIAAMLAGIAAAAGGLAVPGAEPMVTATVIVLGLFVAAAPRRSGRWALPLVTATGLMHGYVHGVEMPADGAAYIAGVVVGSILLHTAGVCGGLALSRASNDGRGLRDGAAAVTAAFTLAWSLGLAF